MKKYAITAVNDNSDYLFFAPIWSGFWKKMGYEPYIITISKDISKNVLDIVEQYTTQMGGTMRHLEYIEGYKTSTIAQVSRLYASADPMFNDEDYLITDDIDKFVVSKPWFNQQDYNKSIHIFDLDETNYTRLKIGYIGMKAYLWKEIMNISDSTLHESVEKCLTKNLPRRSDWDSAKVLTQSEKEIDQGWNLDELLLTRGVFSSGYYPEKCQIITRGANHLGLRNGRIDRTFWKQTFMQYLSTRIIDVHLHRDPYEEDIWKDIKLIMTTTFNKQEIESFEQYKQEFVRSLNE
jgi:hypothetical protein